MGFSSEYPQSPNKIADMQEGPQGLGTTGTQMVFSSLLPVTGNDGTGWR